MLKACSSRFKANSPRSGILYCGWQPDQAVRQLERQPGVKVTGRVPDVRPYLQHFTGGGRAHENSAGCPEQLFQGMAMARPVLVSSKGLEGIAAKDGVEILLADSPDDYARLVGELLAGKHPGLGAGASLRAA